MVLDASGKRCGFEFDEAESLGKQHAAGVVENNHEVDFQLHEGRRGEFSSDVCGIFALEVGVGLVPRGIFAGGTAQSVEFVVKCAGGPSKILSGEIFLDVREAPHENEPGEQKEAANEANRSGQDDSKGFPTE